MPTIYIRDKETTVGVDSSHFTLRSNGRRVCRIAPTVMEQVILGHGVQVTRPALDRLGALGIPVTFLDREARVQARLVPPWKYDATGRLGQARAYFDPAARLTIARRLIDAKLANGATLLRRHSGNHPNPALNEARSQIQKVREKLSTAENLDSLRGFEGIGARIWFGVLGQMLRVPWATFERRTRQPPRDPVNAVLSYAYAVLTHQVLAGIEAIGLDPYIGYLHENEPRRPNLALDLMEPLRPVLGDRLVLRLVNLGTLGPENFREERGPGHGIFIDADGRLALLEAFSGWITSCDSDLGPGAVAPSSILDGQIARFAACALKHRAEDFIPFYLDPSEAPRP